LIAFSPGSLSLGGIGFRVLTSRVLRRKEGLLFVRSKGGQAESSYQRSVVPLLRENVHFLKRGSGTQFEYLTKLISHSRCWPWFSRGLLVSHLQSWMSWFNVAGRRIRRKQTRPEFS
jgi:hypothetical protein